MLMVINDMCFWVCLRQNLVKIVDFEGFAEVSNIKALYRFVEQFELFISGPELECGRFQKTNCGLNIAQLSGKCRSC